MKLTDKSGNERVCTALCSILCATTGSPGANDISMIRQGMRDVADADLFRVLKLNGRRLRFRYSSALADVTTHYMKAKFAILDCGIIAQLRSPWQIEFYTRAEMVQRQRHPRFYLPRVCPEKEPWSETKRRWFSAASRVGDILGHHYVFIPEPDELCEHVARVKVKIVHQRTQWSEGRLFPRRAAEPVSIVANGKSQTLTRQDLTRRKNWTLVAGPVPDAAGPVQ